MLREEIVLAQDMGNYIMVDTELSLDSPDDCLALRFPTDKAGCICHSIYTIEKDTFMIMEKQTILCDEEGREGEYSTSTTELLSQLPMAQEEMLNELESQGENNPRTITVTYDPDTSEQKSFSVTVNAETILHYYFLADYDLFSDKQGLEPLKQIPEVGDVQIYGISEGN